MRGQQCTPGDASSISEFNSNHICVLSHPFGFINHSAGPGLDPPTHLCSIIRLTSFVIHLITRQMDPTGAGHTNIEFNISSSLTISLTVSAHPSLETLDSETLELFDYGSSVSLYISDVHLKRQMYSSTCLYTLASVLLASSHRPGPGVPIPYCYLCMCVGPLFRRYP